MTAFAALLANAPVRADEPAPEAALAELEALVGASDTLRGRFEQRLVDEIGNVQSVSAGTIEVRRPGRFRWHYLEPYEQIIVGDGAIVWLYDVDLDQVTATRVDEALASSPAALLGGGALSEAFEPVAAHQREGLDWVVLEPLVDDSDFERVVVGYDEEGVRQMRLTDALGQVTEIEFLDVERDVDLPSGRFEFTPPPGVDVIGPDKP
jgi:outer membrane lipoprotein carrier protein